MRFDRIAQIVSILANLGVLAGFIFVAVQVQQNSQALKVQSDALISSASITAESSFIGENVAQAYAVAIRNPAELSDAQILSIWGYLSTTMIGVQRTFLNYKEGIASTGEWQDQKAYAVLLLDWPFGRLWWQEAKLYYPEELALEIDQAISKASASNTLAKQLRTLSIGAKEIEEDESNF